MRVPMRVALCALIAATVSQPNISRADDIKRCEWSVQATPSWSKEFDDDPTLSDDKEGDQKTKFDKMLSLRDDNPFVDIVIAKVRATEESSFGKPPPGFESEFALINQRSSVQWTEKALHDLETKARYKDVRAATILAGLLDPSEVESARVAMNSKSASMAEQWYFVAASAGYPEAEREFSKFLSRNGKTKSSDGISAREWMWKAAQSGDGRAETLLSDQLAEPAPSGSQTLALAWAFVADRNESGEALERRNRSSDYKDAFLQEQAKSLAEGLYNSLPQKGCYTVE